MTAYAEFLSTKRLIVPSGGITGDADDLRSAESIMHTPDLFSALAAADS